MKTRSSILFFFIFAAALLPAAARAEGEIGISLRIETPSTTIANAELQLPDACEITDSTSTTHSFEGYKAICALPEALEAVLIESFQFDDFGFGLLLADINGVANANDWSETWIIRHNTAAAPVGLGDLVLAESDELLLTFGPWASQPLRAVPATTTMELGGSLDIAAEVWNDDTAIYEPFLSTTTFYIGSENFITASGTLSWTPSATGTFALWIEAAGKTRSEILAISATSTPPAPQEEDQESADEEQNDTAESGENDTEDAVDSSANDSGNSGGASGSGTPPPPPPSPVSNELLTQTAQKILAFLKKSQNEDGSIVDGPTTDWLMMSFGAGGEYSDDISSATSTLLDFAIAYQFDHPSELNLCASYARHILALYSAGVAQNDTRVIILLDKLRGSDCYSGTSFGIAGINDDVFSLMALLAGGESYNTEVVATIVESILADQQASGAFTWSGFEGADITGAAINALAYAQTKGVSVSSTVFTNAKSYLKSTQLSDGGWGYGTSDIITTSWALMGIHALQETQNDWFASSGKNPYHPLTQKIQSGGYYTSPWSNGQADWFETKHAVPALLGKSWPIILSPKPAPVVQTSSQSFGSGLPPAPPQAQPQAQPAETAEVEEQDSLPAANAVETPLTPSPAPPQEQPAESVETDEQDSLPAADAVETPLTPSPPPLTPLTSPPPLTPPAQEIAKIANEPRPEVKIAIDEPEQAFQEPTQLVPATQKAVPLQKTARGVFGGAATLAGGLGAYLAWRLLQTLI